MEIKIFFSFFILISDEEEYYKPVPPPKPVSNNQKNQNFQQSQQTIVEAYPKVTSGQSGEDTLARNSVQTPAPEYRMPPLYGDEQSSNQAQQAANLQTHSSKFPVSFFSIFYFTFFSPFFLDKYSPLIFTSFGKRFYEKKEREKLTEICIFIGDGKSVTNAIEKNAKKIFLFLDF